jgi:hypothetical protein
MPMRVTTERDMIWRGKWSLGHEEEEEEEEEKRRVAD